VTAFAATLDGNPESPLMNFVRVELTNHSKHSRAAYFGIGTRIRTMPTRTGVLETTGLSPRKGGDPWSI